MRYCPLKSPQNQADVQPFFWSKVNNMGTPGVWSRDGSDCEDMQFPDLQEVFSAQPPTARKPAPPKQASTTVSVLDISECFDFWQCVGLIISTIE